MKIGLLPLGRPTFDVPYAVERLAAMLSALEATGAEITGPRDLLMDGNATQEALQALGTEAIDLLLVLQVTFTDAAAIVEAANVLPETRLAIWAVPEPRLGGRLRLNAFCGLNLASHALGLSGRSFGWLYANPEGDVAEDLAELLAGQRESGDVATRPATPGQGPVPDLSGKRIGRIGEHPVGFDTCKYDKSGLQSLLGIDVTELELADLFKAARRAPAPTEARELAEQAVSDLDDVDAEELDRSLRLKLALDEVKASGDFDAFAIRCWPETFTEYGGAICGPVSMMGEARVPCACEADVYGAATQLLLQAVADAPVFLVDLVDVDPNDGTGVVWHCGQAPISMRDPEADATATIHTNRKMPLLYQFPLKPGAVTFARISQAKGRHTLVIGKGEMLRRPLAFTGTSGVVALEDASGTLNRVIDSGLEHHTALAYGDHRAGLEAAAAKFGLEIIEL